MSHSDAGQSYFVDASVERDGEILHFSAEEGRALEGGSQYWHGPSDPSSWLAVATFQHIRHRVGGEGGNALPLALTAKALNVTVETLIDKIRWHESYMQFREADYAYRVL